MPPMPEVAIPRYLGKAEYATRVQFPNNQIPVNRFDPAAVKVTSYIPAVGGDALELRVGGE